MSAAAWLILGGCAGYTAGGNATLAVSTAGRPRIELDAPVGTTTRPDNAPTDATYLLAVTVEPRVFLRTDDGTVGGGLGAGFGSFHFDARVGVYGVATIGIALDRVPDSGDARGRFFARVAVGFALETNGGDWTIDVDYRPPVIGGTLGSSDFPAYNKRTTQHGVFTASLGLEYASDAAGLDHDFSFLLSSGYRGFFEDQL